MLYIFDANNLAGVLGIIEKKTFDRELIAKIDHFFTGKNHRLILVFDGHDQWGDKIRRGKMTIVYAQANNSHESADDKIIEILKRFPQNKQIATDTEVVLVTDDIDLGQEALRVAKHYSFELDWLKAGLFSKRLSAKFSTEKNDKDVSEDKLVFSNKVIDELNQELLDKWQ